MYNTFILEGPLADKYGAEHRFIKRVSRTTRDFAYMMEANFKGFLKDFKKWGYFIYVGKNKKRQLMSVQEAQLPHQEEITYVIPKIRAHKNGKGFFGLIIGIALVAASWWAGGAGGWAYLGMMGASLALSSAAALMTPMPSTPDYTDTEDANNRPSYMFKGTVNTMEQGQTLPVAYGVTYIGSIVLGASIVVEDDTDA